MGLDYSGWVYINDSEVSEFKGTHVPHTFDLTGSLKESGNILEIIFDVPPRWLGQFGYTSKMIEWKPRYNYTWDWIPRLVQIGIWDRITLLESDGEEINEFGCTSDVEMSAGTGKIMIWGKVSGSLRMTEWKPRFNYTWDWMPRLVQIGIWDKISLVSSNGEEFKRFRCTTDVDVSSQMGKIWIQSEIGGVRAGKIRCLLIIPFKRMCLFIPLRNEKVSTKPSLRRDILFYSYYLYSFLKQTTEYIFP